MNLAIIDTISINTRLAWIQQLTASRLGVFKAAGDNGTRAAAGDIAYHSVGVGRWSGVQCGLLRRLQSQELEDGLAQVAKRKAAKTDSTDASTD